MARLPAGSAWRGDLGGAVAQNDDDGGGRDCSPEWSLRAVASADDVLLKPGRKRAPQHVREMRKDKKIRMEQMGGSMVDGAHRNMQFSSVTVAEHGGAFRGVWGLPRGDFWAERGGYIERDLEE
jgi:hypothetical protein